MLCIMLCVYNIMIFLCVVCRMLFFNRNIREIYCLHMESDMMFELPAVVTTETSAVTEVSRKFCSSASSDAGSGNGGQCLCAYSTQGKNVATIQLTLPSSRGATVVVSGMVFMDSVPVFDELVAQLYVGLDTEAARLFLVTTKEQEEYVRNEVDLLRTDEIVLSEKEIVCSDVVASTHHTTLKYRGDAVEARHCAVVIKRIMRDASSGGLSSKDLEEHDIEDFRSVITTTTTTGESGVLGKLDGVRITVRRSETLSIPPTLLPASKRIRGKEDDEEEEKPKSIASRGGRGGKRGGRR